MNNPIEIEVCERLSDYWTDYADGGKHKPMYHAQVKGRPELWSCGRTRAEAIGDLIETHRAHFGVFVTHLVGKQPR